MYSFATLDVEIKQRESWVLMQARPSHVVLQDPCFAKAKQCLSSRRTPSPWFKKEDWTP